MRIKSLPVLFLCFHFCLISCLYFFALCLHINCRWILPIDAILILTSIWLLHKYSHIHPLKEKEGMAGYGDLLLWVILSGILFYKTLPFSVIDGHWDAWAMWNTHAKFLTSSDNWQLMFDPAMYWNSPDYPLNLPAFIAAFWVYMPHPDKTIPYLAALFATLAIPAIIYFEISGRNRLLAIVAFIILIKHEAFLKLGMAQYADVLLGLFYLCSLVCLDNLTTQTKEDKPTAFLTGFFIAAVLWTKNEGWLFVTPLVLVFASTFLKQKNRYIFLGMMIPFLALIVFKVVFAPRNFGTSHFSFDNLRNFSDIKRYQVIFDFLHQLITEKFGLMPYAIAIQVILIVLRRKIDRYILVMLFAFLLYLALFVFFNFELQWQLSTSLDRLLIQLEIPFVFVFFKTLSEALGKISYKRSL